MVSGTGRVRPAPMVGVCVLGVLAAIAFAVGCATTGGSVDESTVTLNFQSIVGAVAGDTALISFSVTPEAPATMTLPSTAALKITDAEGTSSSASPNRVMGGFRVDTPVVIRALGRATMTLLPTQSSGVRQTTSTPLVIEDGYGNSLKLRSLAVEFDNEAHGVTTLPRSAALTTPLAGGPLTLGSVLVSGLREGTRVAYSVTFENTTRVEDEGRADSGGNVAFSVFPTAIADDVTSATVTFGPDLSE